MAKVYVDENASRSLVHPLRSSGHDVVSASETGRGYSDVWHFQRAVSDARTIITLDSGFYFLHGLWTTLVTLRIGQLDTHSGILTAVQDAQFTHDAWLAAIEPELANAQELKGRILTWHPREQVWKEDLRPPWKGII